MSEVNSCVLCGTPRVSGDGASHGSIRGNTSRFLRQAFRLWRCPKCATIHAVDPVNFSDIYRDYPPNTSQRLDYFARGRFHNLLGRLIRAGLKQSHSILDFGCGNGTFVAYLKGRGYLNVTGYDPFVPEFAKLDQDRKYDFILANDVIEHLDDPREAFDQCSKLLQSHGILYLGTANADGVDIHHPEAQILQLHQPFHRVILTQAGLDRLAKEARGFTLIKTYQRSYMDTHLPLVNYRFLDEFNRALDYDMDRAFKPVSGWLFLRNPRLIFFAFFGFFFPSAIEPAIILQKV